MQGHAKKCVEQYCELANKTTQRLYKVSTPCIDDHHFKEEEMKTLGEMAKSVISNSSDMLVLGTYWKTWYSVVSEQSCTIDYEMDQSLWQTTESIELLHSSRMWIQTVLLCGWYCKKMQAQTVSRLRFCQRSWGLKIYFGWNIVRLWKSYSWSDTLDV